MKRGDQEAFIEKVKGDLSVTRLGRLYEAPRAGGRTEEALRRESTHSHGVMRENRAGGWASSVT